MPSIALSLNETLLARLEERATKLDVSPSGLLRRVVEDYLSKNDVPRARRVIRGEEKARLLQDLNEAWEDGLDAEERAALEGLQKKYRKIARDPW